MARLSVVCLLLGSAIALGQGFDFKAFDDNILFRIGWPGQGASDLLEPPPNTELYTITSPNKEQYQCIIPDIADKELLLEGADVEKNPIDVLSPMFEPNSCSFRLESYWTYELCHGRYVLQYHEERDGKKSQIQKYELGTFDPHQLKVLSAKYDELLKNPNRKSEIPVKKIDGVNMPYVEIEMTGGTICDINNKPRSVRVFYVCHQHDKHEIYSIKEVASCEYEAIVKTPWLCEHPDYRLQDTEENKIICRPLGNAPRKPRSLMALEAERMKMRYQKVSESKQQNVLAILRVDTDGQDGHSQLRVEIHPLDSSGKHFALDNTLNYANQGNHVLRSNTIEDFLNGENCLHGGTGWWKFQFCYGRSVTQYHLETDGTKTVIELGKFDIQKHKEWIDKYPENKPKSMAKKIKVSHLYSNGFMCYEIDKPRQTEVILKCVQKHIGSPNSVAMYLKEHKTCEYELVVESRLFCDILEYADDTYGIIDVEKIIGNLDKITSNLRGKTNDEMVANKDEL